MITAASYHKGKHLNENDLNEEIKNCPFCNGDRLKTVGYIQKNPFVFLLECLDCGCFTASNVPKDEVITEYYGKYYNDIPTDKPNVTFDNSERFARHLLNEFKIKNKSNVKILDFAGGDGANSKAIANLLYKNDNHTQIKHISIDLVEISSVALPSDTKSIKVRKFDSLSDLQETSYDLVIASAIIEHLPYPAIEFYKLFDMVAEAGYFYARTPYMSPFLRFFNKVGINFDITYPAHIHDLGDKFWNNAPLLIKKKINKQFEVLKSQPSIVETDFKHHFIKTFIAYTLKSPWYFLSKRYKFVGGWEIFLQRKS